jgi:hypothetical protein
MSETGALEPLRQIGLAGQCRQHDMPLHQRVNAIGGERFFQEQLDQPRGSVLCTHRLMTLRTRSTGTGDNPPTVRPASADAAVVAAGRLRIGYGVLELRSWQH